MPRITSCTSCSVRGRAVRSRHLILILLGFLIVPGASLGGDMSAVREALDKAKNQTQSITLPSVKNNQAASEAARIYYSPEYQTKLQKEIHRLKKTLFPDAAESRKPSVSKTAPGQKYLLMPDERIYVFISCLLYTSPSPRDLSTSRMPSSA